MGYSTISEVDLILAQALTSATPEAPSTQRVKLINIGNSRNTNLVPDDTVEYYINLADSQIDGILTQMYFTPFDKCAHGEWKLDEDINQTQTAGTGTDATAGTDTAGDTITASAKTVVVESSCNLVPGDEVLIHDPNVQGSAEWHVVDTIVDQYTFTTVDDIVATFLAANNIRVIRLRFPPPLNQISARYAASFIYDKFFAAQAQPNTSDYGKEMRAIAMGQLNDILNGKIIVKCGKRRGDIFGNPWIDDTYQHRDRGYNTSERDMSRPQ
jgi:hypothetical protein